MTVEQIYTGCLAEAAYYIESKGEAVVIDPMREVEPYIERAEKDGAKIKYVILTHFHADFVSGHLELARKTGATIIYGPTATPNYEIKNVEDGEILPIGEISLKCLHTPGHTLESTSFLLRDKDGKDHCLFSGDALFIGDVGRPDLAIKQGSITQDDLAGMLFDSLRNKIMPLADDVIIYPNHGAGSSCGKKMSSETFGFLGEQKRTNYALRADMTKEEFIAEVTDGLVAPPQYFPKNAMMNKMGYGELDEIRKKGTQALSPRAFKAAWEGEEALVIDTRSKEDFAKAFVPGATYFGIDGSFATWIGTLITDLNQPILFIADKGREEEVVDRLARVGYENPIGYLEGGMDAWVAAGEEADSVKEMSPEDLAKTFDGSSDINLLDNRKCSEFDTEHVDGAVKFNLKDINQNMGQIDNNTTYHLYCATGYRSLVAASILKSRGCSNIVNIPGGYEALEKTAIKRTEHVEQNTEM